MQIYEFTDVLRAHAFHAEALQYGPAKWLGIIAGWSPETWQVGVCHAFDAIVEARRAGSLAVVEGV